MCGSNDQQKQIGQEQADFYQQGTEYAKTAFGEDQQLLKQITSVYSPILAAGPSQRGFSAAERADLNAGVVQGTAQNYAGASRAVNESIAARGGSADALPSGGEAELKGELAASSASQESQEENEVNLADYQQGFNQFTQAGQALSTARGQLSPTSYLNSSTSMGTAASDTWNQIAQQNNSWINAAIGAAGTIGGGYLGGLGKKP